MTVTKYECDKCKKQSETDYDLIRLYKKKYDSGCGVPYHSVWVELCRQCYKDLELWLTKRGKE